YMPDYDFASHLAGPGAAEEALLRSDAAIWALVEASGGPDEFLERYAVLLCADHGQTRVERAVRLEDRFADAGVIVTASNRAGMVYRTDATRADTRELAARLDSEQGAEAVLFLEGSEAIARRAAGLHPPPRACRLRTSKHTAATRWLPPSSAAATSSTSACCARWKPFPASASSASDSRGVPTTTRPCRSAGARRSPSRTWLPASARRCG